MSEPMRTVKTSTAIRAWRRGIQLLALIIAMYYSAGTYTLGFALISAVALCAVWKLGYMAIRALSIRGKLDINKII